MIKRHPLAFTFLVTVIICAVMLIGVLVWDWQPGDWDLPGM